LDVGWWQFEAQPIGAQLVCFLKQPTDVSQLLLDFYYIYASHVRNYILKFYLKKYIFAIIFLYKVLFKNTNQRFNISVLNMKTNIQRFKYQFIFS
jgi:hypothetical protein